MKSIVSARDMQLKDRLFRFTSPQALPISFCCRGRVIRGIPAEFHPTVTDETTEPNVLRHTVRGQNAEGLEIAVQYVEYLDYAGTELLAFFSNKGNGADMMISDFSIIDGVIPCEDALLVHGNGDTTTYESYDWFRDPVDHFMRFSPRDGTSCNGAFPYMRLQMPEFGVNIAVGWPARWAAEFSPATGGVKLRIGQRRCHMLLRPGETMRTPRVNFLAYTGDEERGTNMWRRWYMEHILPRPNGVPLAPKCCMHVFGAEGKPEFTAASEQNQLLGIRDYLAGGLHPDVWWIDAGWYPCDYEWTRTGSWYPDPARFPNGLAPIGEECEKNGINFLLWFEPERARRDSKLYHEHPGWTLECDDGNPPENRNLLVNLGDKECCDYIIETVDALIKKSHIHVYRQDFNMDCGVVWDKYETEDRLGAMENLHVQGYLRLWDTILARNPGLWIDSCAGGGRRNDLETMRRAVPLHYTDVGYGNHPVKQKQHRQMFAWIPYFRAHNMNWDNPETGEYDASRFDSAPDSYAYYVAMAPSLTDMTKHDAPPQAFALARKMQAVWRKAAAIMLESDYYPLTVCRGSGEDYYAMQFHNPDTEAGFFEMIRNNRCVNDLYCTRLRALDPGATYVLRNAESGEEHTCTGKELTEGIEFPLPVRSGAIWFYEKMRQI